MLTRTNNMGRSDYAFFGKDELPEVCYICGSRIPYDLIRQLSRGGGNIVFYTCAGYREFYDGEREPKVFYMCGKNYMFEMEGNEDDLRTCARQD